MKSGKLETVAPVEAEIHDRGRGPEIKGTRITVYAILDCLLESWPAERIADWFNIKTPQVEAAIDYIREHTIEVLTEYLRILEDSARGNPPELQAKLDASHEKFQELAKEVRAVKAQAEADIHGLIRQFRASGAKEAADARNHGGQ